MRWAAVIAAALAAVPLCPAQPAGKAPAPQAPVKKAAKVDVEAVVRGRVASILNAAGDDGSFSRLSRDLQTLVDQVIAYAPQETGALVEAAAAQRLVQLLASAEKDAQRPLLAYLRKHAELGRTLAFLARPGGARGDNPRNVCAVLDKLRLARGDEPGAFPPLTAAICVVHDTPVPATAAVREAAKARRAPRPRKAQGEGEEEERPRTIDPVDVFRYYASREGRMAFSMRETPPELLVYVVDSPAEIAELDWALSRYNGDRNPGNRYNEITYDTASFKQGKPKKIEALEYTLPNIRKVGGVCEEQAYFAANVGKAIGVPATMIVGRDASVAHAWVGVLHRHGGGVHWELDEGCFGDYKKLRGHVTDPQTRRRIAAQELHLLVDTVAIPAERRHAAVALADAAQRLAALSRLSSSKAWPPPPLPGMEGAAPATPKADLATALEFLERAVKAAPTSTAVWAGLAPMARSMSAEERERWCAALYRACARSQDFCHRMLGLMIEALEEPRERASAWAWAAQRATGRADLKTEALLERGEALEAAGDKGGAYACYEEVWRTLINEAAEAVESLTRAERLLRASDKDGAVLAAYADAFRRVMRPSTTSSFSQSNFYRVGSRYATLLDAAGQANQARNVRSQISPGEPKN